MVARGDRTEPVPLDKVAGKRKLFRRTIWWKRPGAWEPVWGLGFDDGRARAGRELKSCSHAGFCLVGELMFLEMD